MHVNKISITANKIDTPATMLMNMNRESETVLKTFFSIVLSCGTFPPTNREGQIKPCKSNSIFEGSNYWC